MNKISGWFRLLIVISIFWGILICIFSWQIYDLKKERIYQHWYSELYGKLNDSSLSWIENPELTFPQLIEVIEGKLKKNNDCSTNTDPFCDLILKANVEKIRNKYKNQLNHILTTDFIARTFLFWIIPIVVLYLIGVSVSWIYRGFKNP